MRQLTGDIYPGASYGLNSPTSSGALDGTQGTLTTEGKAVFPYLKESVGIDTGTYGYEATPLATQVTGASFHTLVSGPQRLGPRRRLHAPQRRLRKWSRPSTRTSTSCRPSCCATAP